MSRVGGVLLSTVGAAVLAGCGSDGADDEAPPAPGPIVAAAPVSGPPITDASVLGGLLLGAADLPSGMEPAPRTDAQSGVDRSRTSPAECGAVLEPLALQRPDALTRNAVGFNGPNFSSIDIDAATYSNETIASAFDAVQRTLRGCGRYSGTDADSTVIRYRLGGLEQPASGDAATSFRLELTSEGFTLVSLATVVQVGNTLAQISVTAPESVDPGVLTDLTAAQVRRLRGIAGP